MATNIIELVRNKIKYYRKINNLTQEDLSEKSGISSDYISEIERGKKNPSIKRLYIIADVLNIEAYKLLKPLN